MHKSPSLGYTRNLRPRLGTAAIALVSAMIMMQAVARGEEVRVFDYAPPLETLRNILIPESDPSASRKIVIPRYDTLDAGKPVQPAALHSTNEEIGPQSAGASVQESAVERAPSTKTTAAPPAAPQDASAGIVGFRINFAFNSSEIPESAVPFLDRMAELMRQEPKLAIVIEGHTDAYGGVPYNLELSERRARAVGLALVQRGVAGERLAVIGKGKGEPLTADGYDPRNRRVQFARTGNG